MLRLIKSTNSELFASPDNFLFAILIILHQLLSFAQLALVTRPASGSSRPARILSSVDLPPPLRPTIPMRSPSEIPSDTSTNRGMISKAFETPSILMMLRALAQG